jgi:hypothetical protein
MDAASHPALLLVDGVSSIGALPFKFDEWRVDVAVTGSQKALSLPTGLGLVCASNKVRRSAALGLLLLTLALLLLLLALLLLALLLLLQALARPAAAGCRLRWRGQPLQAAGCAAPAASCIGSPCCCNAHSLLARPHLVPPPARPAAGAGGHEDGAAQALLL